MPFARVITVEERGQAMQQLQEMGCSSQVGLHRAILLVVASSMQQVYPLAFHRGYLLLVVERGGVTQNCLPPLENYLPRFAGRVGERWRLPRQHARRHRTAFGSGSALGTRSAATAACVHGGKRRPRCIGAVLLGAYATCWCRGAHGWWLCGSDR